LVLLAVSAWGDWSLEEKQFLITTAGMLIALALGIRIIWGLAVAIIRRRKQAIESREREG